VLGGGGARGLAHVGVIRALLEAKVPIDMIGGTSMGAVIASLAAMGRDWKQMMEINRDAWIHRKPHTEYGPPIISLVLSRRLDRMAQHIWGDACIEDLWLNFSASPATSPRVKCRFMSGGPCGTATGPSNSSPWMRSPTWVTDTRKRNLRHYGATNPWKICSRLDG
jgi:NTE family protein